MKLEKWNSPDFPADKIGNETVNDSIMRRINHLFRSNRLSNCYGFCLSFHLLRFQLRIFFLKFSRLGIVSSTQNTDRFVWKKIRIHTWYICKRNEKYSFVIWKIEEILSCSLDQILFNQIRWIDKFSPKDPSHRKKTANIFRRANEFNFISKSWLNIHKDEKGIVPITNHEAEI